MNPASAAPSPASPAFAFTEMLQHYAQSGRTGMFEIHSTEGPIRVYLMTGIVVHAENTAVSGEAAVWEALALPNPAYTWVDSRTPSHMTMSASAQELLLRFIQLQGTGELERIRSHSKSQRVTRNLEESGMLFIMGFEVQSREIAAFHYAVQTRQVRVGRHTDNDLVLSDSSVSRKHAIFILNNDTILVRDLGSKNGISINGQPVTQGLLRDGEILSVGEVILKLSVSKAARPAAAAAVAAVHA